MAKCVICGSGHFAYKNKQYGDILCSRHAYHWKYFGEFKKTQYERNEIIKKGRVAQILLRNKDGVTIAKALIDAEDISRVNNEKWNLSKYGYAVSNNIRLSRLIMNEKRDVDVDHVNGNKLDDRRKNLRSITHQQNCFNQRAKGVYKYKNNKQYYAKINVDLGQIYLGSFNTFAEAKHARLDAEKKYFGKYRRKTNKTQITNAR